MNKAFRIAGDLVQATIRYHVAVKGGDEDDINRAYRMLCSIQNELSACCEDLADEALETV